MLNFTKEKVRVDVAPGYQIIIIGVGEETQAIALEILNEGDTSLASLKLKYGHGVSGQWWGALVKEKDFTQPSSFLRKWDGPNPYTLPKGEKSILYLDVAEIDALRIEAIASGDKTTYPEPYTCITVKAYSIKLARYGAAAVSAVDAANTSLAQSDGTLVANDVAYIPTGAQSFSIYNSGTGSAYVCFPNDDGTWKSREYPPGSNFNWSVSTSYERYPEIRIDATGTEIALAASGVEIVTGDAAQAMGTMGAVIPRVAAPEGAVKVEWDLSSLNAGASYAINLYPVAATVYTQAIKTVSFEDGDAHQFTVEPSDKRTGFSNLVLSGVTPGKYKVAVAQVNETGALLLDVKFTVA